MKINKKASRIMPVLVCLCLSSLPFQPLSAADEIRVHRANQYYKLKKQLHRNQHSRAGYHHFNNQRYRSRSNSSSQVVPDSRFPNSYSEFSYQQRLQAQSWRDQ